MLSSPEAVFSVTRWAISCMRAHHMPKVIFAISDSCVVEIITRPKRWPSFKPQGLHLLETLQEVEWWRVQNEERITNRGADLIARSVTKEKRFQSYVAAGSPLWLRHIFDNEITLPSTRL